VPEVLAAVAAAPAPAAASLRRAFRLGDAVLDVASDCDALVALLDAHYGECETPDDDPHTRALPHVRCTVRDIDDGLALVRFDSALAAAPFEIALGQLRHPAADPQYVEGPPQPGGWRPILHAATGRIAVAARDRDVLVDVARVGAYLVVRLLVDAALGLQRSMLFAHAASIGIGAGGVLLVGPSGAGKTTTALGLASRGHRYFGDDVAAIRMDSGRLLPFWRIAHIRPGPRAGALAPHLAGVEWDAPYADGLPRQRLRVADAFPEAASQPLPLARVLFLRRFAEQPRIEPFEPRAAHFAAGSRFALNNTLWVAWGTTPSLRLLQFMSFLRLLERVSCAWLDVADPEATADLVEHTSEDSWH